jgi:aryl-alcohol dehydrogenase (NADP+)
MAERGDTSRAKSDTYAEELYVDARDFDVADRCADVARRRGVAPAQVALAWLLQRPGVTAPIVGATKLEQLDQAVGALAVRLEAEEIRQLEELYVPHPVLGHE